MEKKRVACALMCLFFITPLVQVKTSQINSKPKKSVDCAEKVNLRNYKIEQVEEMVDFKIQKLKEIEEEEREEIERQRLLEEQTRPRFNPYDVTEVSHLNKEQIYKMLEGTDLVTLVDAFYWYEQVYEVNLIFIASIVALESSWGRSSLAISHNNLTGYVGRNGEYYYFDSWGENLKETFRLIGDEYTKEDGLFYNGKSVWNVNQKYCELDSWADKVINIGNGLYSKIN